MTPPPPPRPIAPRPSPARRRRDRLCRLGGDLRRDRARGRPLVRASHLRLGDRPLGRLVRARRGRVAALARHRVGALVPLGGDHRLRGRRLSRRTAAPAGAGHQRGRGRGARRRARPRRLGDGRAHRRRAGGQRRHRRRGGRRTGGRAPPRQTATEAVAAMSAISARRLMRGDGGDAAAVLTRNLADGEMSAEDRDYLVSMVAERTGQTPEEAGAAVDTAVAEAQASSMPRRSMRQSRPGSPGRSPPSSSPRR